jgi:sterol 3beta-glucosyltransferase
MVDHERESVTRIIIDALNESHQRGVLQRGWSTLDSGSLSDSIMLIEAIPHDWLFPQMAAVVHHGGAGTTAAGLRAGTPTIIVPSFGDQFFWGRRVHELGAGPEPIPRKKLTVERLAEAIRQTIEDDTIGNNVDRLGQQIRAENGVEAAVQMIETFSREGHL